MIFPSREEEIKQNSLEPDLLKNPTHESKNFRESSAEITGY